MEVFCNKVFTLYVSSIILLEGGLWYAKEVYYKPDSNHTHTKGGIANKPIRGDKIK